MRRLGTALVVIVLGGCSSKMDPAAVLATVAPDKGALVGATIGDTWDSVKENHDPKFSVEDEKIDGRPSRMLRWKIGGYDNQVYTDFTVDAAGKVDAIRTTLMGKGDNAVVVRQLYDDLQKRFETRFGAPTCQASVCGYDVGPGQKLSTRYQKMEGSPVSTLVELAVTHK